MAEKERKRAKKKEAEAQAKATEQTAGRGARAAKRGIHSEANA